MTRRFKLKTDRVQITEAFARKEFPGISHPPVRAPRAGSHTSLIVFAQLGQHVQGIHVVGVVVDNVLNPSNVPYRP